MSLFGSSNRPAFKPTPYGYTRRRKGIPRWLVLMLAGIALGAGGVLFLQRSYGPPRLTAEQSEQLRMDLNSATLDKQRLQTETKQLKENLDQATQSVAEQAEKITQLQQNYAQLESGVSSLIQAIPADPRGANPGVRAAEITSTGQQLSYNVLLIQNPQEGGTQAFDGQVKLIASGSYRNGQNVHIDITTEPLHMMRYTDIQGEATLPDGFRVRQVTIQITPTDSDKVVSTRTIRVVSK
ncbi:hypothetical protein KVP09_11670 [Alcaligenaceae bacterium CGII-47]|nr:hypothetical protein [Alcaligenaceae bacterium CGII-47]